MRRLKRLLYGAIVLCLGVMAGSCDKDNGNSGNGNNQTSSPEASYWAASMSDGGHFYLGFEVLPPNAQIMGTYMFMAETSDGSNATGFASQTNNTISITSNMGYMHFPRTFTIVGNTVTCVYRNEELTFNRITENDFYSSVHSFVKEN